MESGKRNELLSKPGGRWRLWKVDSGQWLVDSGQWLVVIGHWSVVSGKWSAIRLIRGQGTSFHNRERAFSPGKPGEKNGASPGSGGGNQTCRQWRELGMVQEDAFSGYNRRGASFQLARWLGTGKLETCTHNVTRV